MSTPGSHAVVIGGSMGGLLAARALSGPYDRVTVIDRDELPEHSENRRGVPQGRHAHTLLSRGAQILGAMFPGFLDQLEADGAPVLREWACGYARFGGYDLKLPDGPSDQAIYQASRPFLESRVRARVRGLPGVELLPETEATGLIATPAGDRVTGVRIRRNGADADLAADLVLDSTGRGGRAHTWLAELGYQPAPTEEMQIDLLYRTRQIRMPVDALGGVRLVIIGPQSGRERGMFLLGVEDERWFLTLSGYGRHQPPADAAAFDAFTAELVPPAMMAAIRSAEVLTDVVTHRIPTNVRRHYEKLDRFPAGFGVFGDALCAFNPFYGQGMSVAAMQAEALRACLVRGGKDDLATRFFKAAVKPVDMAWQTAVAEDLALAEVPGRRSPRIRARTAFATKVLGAASQDPVVAEAFVRVIGLLDHELRLGAPDIAWRIARSALGPAPARYTPAPDVAAPVTPARAANCV